MENPPQRITQIGRGLTHDNSVTPSLLRRPPSETAICRNRPPKIVGGLDTICPTPLARIAPT